jgi:hypothetical protein
LASSLSESSRLPIDHELRSIFIGLKFTFEFAAAHLIG